MANPLLTGLDWGTKGQSGGEITYFFAPTNYSYANGAGTSAGFEPYEKAQFRLAFQSYETFLGITFREVSSEAGADFNLLTYSGNSSLLGSFYPPGTGPYSGFGFFNYNGVGWDWDQPGSGGLERGGLGFVTIIHELGHGLGLAHPHDNGGGSTIFPGVTSAFGDYGAYNLNQGVYTTMSYNDGWETNPDGPTPSLVYGRQATPMALDIAVLQAKYGANTTYHSGPNTYVLPTTNGVGTFYTCIWDTGGSDAIVNNRSAPSVIDLRAATLQVGVGGGGFLSFADGVHGGLTIANGVVIEAAFGGGGADFIVGNAASNLLAGRGGGDVLIGLTRNDRLIGGAGDDRLVGSAGNDILTGGPDRDILNGGPGRDRFDFNTTFESAAGATRDVIQQFSHTQRDRIDLSSIDANTTAGGDQAFTFIGAQTFAAYKVSHPGVPGMVRVAGTIVQVDQNGNGVVDMTIRVGGSVLNATDFFL